jgi:hypothetical protein
MISWSKSFPSGLEHEGTNALTLHRLLMFHPKCRKAALTTTFSSGMKAKTQVFSLLCLNPQTFPPQQGVTAEPMPRNGPVRWKENLEISEGAVH